MIHKHGKSLVPCIVALHSVILTLIFVLAPSAAFSSNFSISPTSLELDKNVKSGVFTVINSGAEKLNCQIDVKEWGQDAEGKDIYSDTKDIIFFPKIMTVDPSEQRAIRLGIKIPAVAKEKTYRLFVEEIPSQQKPSDEKKTGKISAGLTIAFRYATPVFVKPIKQQESAVIENIHLSKGMVKAVVRNTGNIHIKLLNVTFQGKAKDGSEIFSKDVAGWYILNGLSRPYEVAVPKELCNRLASIEVNAQSENFTINGKLNVQKNMCAQ